MKKIILSIALAVTVLNCTSFRESWERVDRRMKERGYECSKDPYYGNTHCGYKN